MPKREATQALRGERDVLVRLLLEADKVLGTIDGESQEEWDMLLQLRRCITAATMPHRRTAAGRLEHPRPARAAPGRHAPVCTCCAHAATGALLWRGGRLDGRRLDPCRSCRRSRRRPQPHAALAAIPAHGPAPCLHRTLAPDPRRVARPCLPLGAEPPQRQEPKPAP